MSLSNAIKTSSGSLTERGPIVNGKGSIEICGGYKDEKGA